VCGWLYARHVEMNALLSGLIFMAIGSALVAIAIALGG
jgi:hypothetical protein